jgi:hypothetical protein
VIHKSFDIDELFKQINSTNAPEPDVRPLTEVADPLALSCASYRMWETLGHRWVNWGDVKHTDQDVEQAQQIRRYYRDRIALQILRGGTVSKFRTELYDICNGGIMRHCHRGMLYKLPYFYAEDTARDQLLGQFKIGNRADRNPSFIKTELTPVRTVFRTRRGAKGESVEYWFQDQKQELYMTDINYSNDYRPLLDSLFRLPSVSLQFTRYPHTHRHSQLSYWGMIKVEIAA